MVFILVYLARFSRITADMLAAGAGAAAGGGGGDEGVAVAGGGDGAPEEDAAALAEGGLVIGAGPEPSSKATTDDCFALNRRLLPGFNDNRRLAAGLGPPAVASAPSPSAADCIALYNPNTQNNTDRELGTAMLTMSAALTTGCCEAESKSRNCFSS